MVKLTITNKEGVTRQYSLNKIKIDFANPMTAYIQFDAWDLNDAFLFQFGMNICNEQIVAMLASEISGVLLNSVETLCFTALKAKIEQVLE